VLVIARTNPHPSGRQPKLSREAILDRALAVADADGIDAVSVRRLARELSVTPMALYWHFSDKNALLHALGDRLLGGLDLTVDERAPWPERLRSFVVSLTAVLRAHPSAAVLIGSLPTVVSENALRATEAALDILRHAGFSPAEAAQITTQIVRTTTSMVIAELDEIPPLGEPTPDKEAFLRALPPDRFPRVIEAASALSTPEDPESFYDLVIELVLAGIEAAAERRRSAPQPSAPQPATGEIDPNPR
jgi:TetR/AcrR family transcriptional regulator, tetracycline repressor protein